LAATLGSDRPWIRLRPSSRASGIGSPRPDLGLGTGLDPELRRWDAVAHRPGDQPGHERLPEVVGAASDGEDLWVAVDGNRLVRIDGATGQREASFRLGRTALLAPRDAGFLAVGHGSIWLTVPKLGDPGAPRELWPIGPRTGTVRAKIDTERIGPVTWHFDRARVLPASSIMRSLGVRFWALRPAGATFFSTFSGDRGTHGPSGGRDETPPRVGSRRRRESGPPGRSHRRPG
jgi:hypothetical protein